ncbi:MAG: GxxExxY protein [Verrucomicrobiota bacterium]|nr:GxxExxY protein [Verrucomicrobiota bacterium]
METSIDQILGAAQEVHRHLGGPGLIENVYEAALCHELRLRNISHQRQVPLPVLYKGTQIRGPFFIDLLVDQKIVIEIKALEKDNPYYQSQLLTHMRLLRAKQGLLINFGKENLEEGIFRIDL